MLFQVFVFRCKMVFDDLRFKIKIFEKYSLHF